MSPSPDFPSAAPGFIDAPMFTLLFMIFLKKSGKNFSLSDGSFILAMRNCDSSYNITASTVFGASPSVLIFTLTSNCSPFRTVFELGSKVKYAAYALEENPRRNIVATTINSVYLACNCI